MKPLIENPILVIKTNPYAKRKYMNRNLFRSLIIKSII